MADFKPLVMLDSNLLGELPALDALVIDGLALSGGTGIGVHTGQVGALFSADRYAKLDFVSGTAPTHVTAQFSVKKSSSDAVLTFTISTDGSIVWDGDYFEVGGFEVWHSGNDGAGSTLDADLLDGQHGTYYAPITLPALSPAQITADQNNYAPTGYATAHVLRLSTDASRTLTGLTAPSASERTTVVVHNVGSNDIVLANQSASSTAANRFLFGANLTIGADRSALLWYDATTQRWRGGLVPNSAGGSGTPAGSNKQIQWNNSGAFGAEAGFEYDPATNTFTASTVSCTTLSSGIALATDGTITMRFHARTADNVGTMGSTSDHDVQLWRNNSVLATIRSDGVEFNNLINLVPGASDPTPLVDGDVWMNSTLDKLRARENGVSRNVIRDITTGAFSSAPSTHDAGDLYLCNDAPALLRSNGSTWDTFGPVFKFTPPVSGDFSWVNQGAATDTASGPYRYISKTGNSEWALRVKSAPTAPYTLTVAVLAGGTPGGQYSGFGICWRDSATGGITAFRIGDNGTQDNLTMQRHLALTKYTNPSTLSANYRFWPFGHYAGVLFLRLVDDNTNRKALYSFDGANWTEIYSVGRTDFHTPDQIGYCIAGTASYTAAMTVLSWVES